MHSQSRKALKTLAISFLLLCGGISLQAQHMKRYDLPRLLQASQLTTTPGQQTQVLNDPDKKGIATRGIVWLNGVDFSEGTIDVDLRGKNIMLQSFLGIAFHAADAAHYDVVYFRPFNFRHADTMRRNWSVQYMSMPDYDYDVLRRNHPLVYEHMVTPVPNPDDWFHARIIIEDGWITAYVDHADQPSLRVKHLNTLTTGKLGLWASGLPGNFANLAITTKK